MIKFTRSFLWNLPESDEPRPGIQSIWPRCSFTFNFTAAKLLLQGNIPFFCQNISFISEHIAARTTTAERLSPEIVLHSVHLLVELPIFIISIIFLYPLKLLFIIYLFRELFFLPSPLPSSIAAVVSSISCILLRSHLFTLLVEPSIHNVPFNFADTFLCCCLSRPSWQHMLAPAWLSDSFRHASPTSTTKQRCQRGASKYNIVSLFSLMI